MTEAGGSNAGLEVEKLPAGVKDERGLGYGGNCNCGLAGTEHAAAAAATGGWLGGETG